MKAKVFQSPVARAVPYDNTSSGVVQTNVQSLLDSLVSSVQDLQANKQPLDADLTSIAAQTGTGYLVRTATNTWTTRSISGTSPITVTNGTGVSGNTTISHANSGVSANTYGTATHVPQFTVNASGHITGVSNVPIAPTTLNYYKTSMTDSISTTSSTYSSLGLSITPAAGTYLAIFNGNMWGTGGGGSAIGNTRMVLGGNVVADTAREFDLSVAMLLGLIGTVTSRPSFGTIVTVITTNGSQAVDIQYNRGSGTIYARSRSLVLVRIS